MPTIPGAIAADWWGTADEKFQTGENWRKEGDTSADDRIPLAGTRNKTALVIQSGTSAPLKYTQADGDTEFEGQLMIGEKKGLPGEMVLAGGVLLVNLNGKWPSIVGQTMDGTLKVTGGILNLHAGEEKRMAAGLPSRWGLIIGNEPQGNGVVEVSGGEVNVGGGLWLGRQFSTGSLAINGPGRFICEGPVLISGGVNIQKIEFGKDGGLFQASLDGELHFLSVEGANNSCIDFARGSKGRLSLNLRDRAYFEKLVNDGRIRIDGAPAKPSQFVFRKNGNQGEYSLAP